MRKETRIDRVEIMSSGVVQVRLKKLIIDGESEHQVGGPDHFHRFTIEPGAPVKDIGDTVNAHLHGMEAGPVSAEALEYVRSICDLVHTPKSVSSHKKRVSKMLAETGISTQA